LSIPSGHGEPTEIAARRELFRTARERWPRPLPAGWEIKASDTGSHLVLSIQTGRREATATFFPLDQDQIDNAAPQVVAPAERGAKLTIQKADPLSKPISMLKGIVLLGSDRAFEIAVPVTARR
jgi:DsbC/DsbD-like thiol-disulfide interchange protein